jgi:hypothetical protein
MKSLVGKRAVINRHKTTNGMLRTTAATVICALALTTSFPTTASAWYPPPHPPVMPPPVMPPPVMPPPVMPPPQAAPPAVTPGGGTSGAAGAGAVTGFIGFVAVIVGYDLLRRTTCVGDFLGLGGPGFTTPITPVSGNVMIPQCPIVKKEPVVGSRG